MLAGQLPEQMAQHTDAAHAGIEYGNITVVHRIPPFCNIGRAYTVVKSRVMAGTEGFSWI